MSKQRPAKGGYNEEQARRLAVELASRRIEALRLYRPTAEQDKFHRSMATERIVRGGNRAGKTLAAAVEFARAATGQDPYNKYPEKDATLFVVGYDNKHLGRVLYTKLFRAGLFKIYKDPKTKQWRPFNPNTDDEKQAKLSPPLIPPRFVKEWAWESRAQRVFTSCKLVNGTEIWAFSSKGQAPQGDSCHLYWIDEDIENEDWIGEAQARLSDVKGRFMWSALPHSRNEALYDLCERADKEAHLENPDIQQFQWRFSDNPFIDAGEKAKRIKSWDDETRRLRDLGEFSLNHFRMYPAFHLDTHGFQRSDLPDHQVPRDWCRYMVVDPGYGRCAVLFAAVPPPEVGDFVLLYKELYIEHCTAKLFAEEVKRATVGQCIREFIIDEHGGRLRDFGTGSLVRDQYSAALREVGVTSEVNGVNFTPGCDDIPARTEAVRNWLHIREYGHTKLRILRDGTACELPHFMEEIKRYRRKIIKGVVTDDPNKQRNIHLMDCLEYLAARNPAYHKPKHTPQRRSYAEQRMEYKKRKRREKQGPRVVVLGGAS